MPTYNRRKFVPLAIKYFLRQDYTNKELLIFDDGTDPIQDLVPANDQIRYVRLGQRATVGTKRNLACEGARGPIIVHWDDDDWYAPHRISHQVKALLEEDVEVCGTNRLLFYDLRTQRAWKYVYPVDVRFWLSGNTLCYTRDFWTRHHFEDIDVGEDGRFVWSADPGQMLAMPDAAFHVGIIHSDNASPKDTGRAFWQAYAHEAIRKLLGTDWDFYSSGRRETNADRQTSGIGLVRAEVAMPMMTTAQADDLFLSEFVAFNHGMSLPWMRRWELPFVLFQARLSNTCTVLDCTINPAGFQERLHRLYPHVLYRHWSPVQAGEFALPRGIPDEAFDRIFCINTLEHLLKPQREALVADLSRKLKPSGWLLLTCDYYFDSFWQRAECLNAGIMRADRQEVFMGWNKVTPTEWLSTCQRYDMHPMAEIVSEPEEGDPNLYRQQQPYCHACIGGVFSKSMCAPLPPAKKIVLALLTWNTSEVSLDSARAIIREARMLRRLGQLALVCICDNGSTDGTADALRSLKTELDVPCELILNRRNLGNSIARNQIIGHMLESDADYLLFTDGDIEIVPFSSFAMLRYMENNGHRLGCIGADSAGWTHRRERASKCLYSIERVESTNVVAWTQYGMFRRAVFEDGIRFDENGPFRGPGWGFEDNDLAFQMEMKGYANERFFGMTYLHREARSSVRIMRHLGIDVHDLYNRRKEYTIHKWASVSSINDGPLQDVRCVTMNL
jgi:glycosyltransferase involved in cell wall biosynthesis